MKVVFRADASIAIGTGHIMRCRTLASFLREKDASIRFVMRAHPGHLGDRLAQDGFSVSMLHRPTRVDAAEECYASWLGVTQTEDAQHTISALENERCDWLIVDHYGLDRTWESLLRPRVGKVMVIDDLANRVHDCDLLLDPNFSNDAEERYRPCVPPDCQMLLGPRYAILRPDYGRYRDACGPRVGPIKRVFLFMGGADNRNITGTVMSALSSSEFAHLEVDVVIGANSIHKESIRDQATKRPNTRVYGVLPHLADLMTRADLAIGAGGSTTWERMCMGLPSIVISIAENQAIGCDALACAGLIRYLARASEIEASTAGAAVEEAISHAEDFRAMGLEGQVHVDGKGGARVAEALIPTAEPDLAVRRATSKDVLTYLAWANDPVVRANSIDSSQIQLRSHLRWFEDRLRDPDCFLFVFQAGTLPVGQIRFDRTNEGLTINYSLESLVRSRGWAKKLLMLGIRELRFSQPTQLNAIVKPGNIASAATFIGAGFAEELMVDGTRRYTLPLSEIRH